MKIVILGSGLLGVTTAYALASRGHEVEVIDRKEASARETSYANGGQLSYSHAEPWANAHVLKKLPKWLIHEDSPLIFRPRLDVEMIRWGLKFLTQCTQAASDKHTLTMLKLGLYSREKMAQIRKETKVAFDCKENGIVHIFSTQKDLDQAARQAAFQERYGCEEKLLSKEQVLALEPALAVSTRPIVGGIHSVMDQSGDARAFCEQLAAYCATTFGTRFSYGTTIQGLEHDGTRVISVATSRGRVKADAFVLAMGSYSPVFTKPLGFRLPIYPMKGYSITVPAGGVNLNVSLTDGTHKIVFSQLGDRLRVAGTAEFAGYNDAILPSRIAPIVRASKALLPQVNWEANEPWACLRPSTPEGPPVLGKTPYANLYLNTGHGTLGWTQAAGSAYMLADIIAGHAPEISEAGLTLDTRGHV